MAKNLENNLIHANANYINFDEHRAEYTAHYDALRKEIYGHWKGHETLGKLVNGYTLGGGYGDNLKVAMPDEFDLVIHLQFPENDKIIVKADPRKPGNVILDMSKVMQILENQVQNKAIFQLLQKIVNNKQQLLEDKLQSLLQGLMSQALLKMGNQIEVNGVVSPLKYKKCGPAHTIEVKGCYQYSVDFVPAIRLKSAQNVLAPEQRQHFGQTEYWDAIPKPMKPAQPENVSFRASYYEAEKKLLHGKNNLKNAIRLLKQHRNTKNNMSNLKSYYIKTLFLWEVTRQDASYWNRSNAELLIEMLTKLSDVLSLSSARGKGKLPFFWDPKLDMIADLSSNQRKDLVNCVLGAQYTFRRADGNLTEDFKNLVLTSFSNGGKDKGLENKPSNGQGTKTQAKVESPPVAKPSQKPNEPKKVAVVQGETKPKAKVEPVQEKPNPNCNEQKKNGEVQNGAKPKAKVEPVQDKPNPNPNPNAQKKNVEPQTGAKPKAKVEPVQAKPNSNFNEQKENGEVQNGAKTKAKVKPIQDKPNPNPNAQKKNGESQNGAKPKAKVEPVQVKPNPKPNEQKPKPNPNQNQPKPPKEVTPPPVQPKQPKAQPPVAAKKAQPEAKPKANVQPNAQPQPRANPSQNGAAQPQPDPSAPKAEASCRIN